MKKIIVCALIMASLLITSIRQAEAASVVAGGVATMGIVGLVLIVSAITGKDALRGKELVEITPEAADFYASQGKEAASPALAAVLHTVREEVRANQGEEVANAISDLDLAKAILINQSAE